jgi:hypothetical protein
MSQLILHSGGQRSLHFPLNQHNKTLRRQSQCLNETCLAEKHTVPWRWRASINSTIFSRPLITR